MSRPLAICLAISMSLTSIWADQAVASDNDFGKILAEARELKKTRQNVRALPLYRKLVKMRPRNSEVRAGYGWVLFELGEIDAGLREEVKAIELNRNNGDAYHHLGTMYLALNMLPQAADQFREAMRIDPTRECNCGPVAGLVMAYPAGSGNTTTKKGQGMSSPPKAATSKGKAGSKATRPVP